MASYSGRNRSQGWQHAKVSGHKYEEDLARKLVDTNSAEHKALVPFLQRQLVPGPLVKVNANPGKAKVLSFSGNLTPSKRDIALIFSREEVGVSVKKSTGGQVQLTQLNRFLEKARADNIQINRRVEKAMRCFTGETGGLHILEFAGICESDLSNTQHRTSGLRLEEYQNRLGSWTLSVACPALWNALSDWIQCNLPWITRTAFSTGFCNNPVDFAKVIFYRQGPTVFLVEDIAKASFSFPVTPNSARKATIDMPWGFLQVHRPGKSSGPFQLQFHHSLGDIRKLLGLVD